MSFRGVPWERPVVLALAALLVVVVPLPVPSFGALHSMGPPRPAPAGASAAAGGPHPLTGSPSWANLTPGLRPSPPPRYAGAFVYDPAISAAILFGGRTTSIYYQDTWEYSRSAWTLVSASSINATNTPPPRYGASALYDPVLGGIVLFGGKDSIGWRSDTWLWTTAGWQNITPASSPPARAYATFVWENTSRAEGFLFGGNNLSGPLDDAWAWNSSSWSPVTSLGTPPSRYGASGAWDPTTNTVVVFGGFGTLADGSASLLNQTWIYNPATSAWVNATPAASPGIRLDAGLVYDPAVSGLLLYGGDQPGGTSWDDLWAYAGGTWTDLTSEVNASFLGRSEGGMVAIPSLPAPTTTILFFGGKLDPAELTNETWVFGDPLAFGMAGPSTPRSEYDVGQNVSVRSVAFGGTPPYSYAWQWSVAGLCPATGGATLVCSLPGAAAGNTLRVTLRASDSAGATATATLPSIFVNAQLKLTLSVTPTDVAAGALITVQVTRTGGSPPVAYTYAGLPSDCAPPKLPVSTFTCNSTAVGAYTVSASGTDHVGASATSNPEQLVIKSTGGGPASSPPWLLYGLIGGGTILVVVALVLIYRSRRGGPPVAAPGGGPPAPRGGSPPPGPARR